MKRDASANKVGDFDEDPPAHQSKNNIVSSEDGQQESYGNEDDQRFSGVKFSYNNSKGSLLPSIFTLQEAENAFKFEQLGAGDGEDGRF